MSIKQRLLLLFAFSTVAAFGQSITAYSVDPTPSNTGNSCGTPGGLWVNTASRKIWVCDQTGAWKPQPGTGGGLDTPTFTGIPKFTNGSNTSALAVPGTDYSLPPTGSGVLKGNGAGGFALATFANIVSLFGGGSCTGVLNFDGTCVSAGSGGTVTSVGGLSPIVAAITTTGNVSCPTCLFATVNPSAGVLHVPGGTQQVTSGQVNLATEVTGNLPHTNLNGGSGASASTFWRGDDTWATVPAGTGTVTVLGSGSLPLTYCVSGGGTTTIQAPSANCTIDSSGNMVVTSLTTGAGASAVTGGSGGFWAGGEGTTPTPAATYDVFWADNTAHRWKMNNNNGTSVNVEGYVGNPTTGNCASFTSTDDLQDSGGPCGGGVSGATANGGLVATGSAPTITLSVDPTQGDFTPAAKAGIICDGAHAAANTTAFQALSNITVRLPDNSVCLINSVTISNSNVHIIIGKNTYLRQASGQTNQPFVVTGNFVSFEGSGYRASHIDSNANVYGSVNSQALSAFGVSILTAGTGFQAGVPMTMKLVGGGCTSQPIGYFNVGTTGGTATGGITSGVIVDPGNKCDGTAFSSVAAGSASSFTSYSACPTGLGFSCVAPTFSFTTYTPTNPDTTVDGTHGHYMIYVNTVQGFYVKNVDFLSTGATAGNQGTTTGGIFIDGSDFQVDGMTYGMDGTLTGPRGIYIDSEGSDTNTCQMKNSNITGAWIGVYITSSGGTSDSTCEIGPGNSFINITDYSHNNGPYGNAIQVNKASGVRAHDNYIYNPTLSCVRNAGASGLPDNLSIATQFNDFYNNFCSSAGEVAFFLGDLGAQLSRARGNTIVNCTSGINSANVSNRPTASQDVIEGNMISNCTAYGTLGSKDSVRNNDITDVAIGSLVGSGGSGYNEYFDANHMHASILNPSYTMGIGFSVDKGLTDATANANSTIGASNTVDSNYCMKGTTTSGSASLTAIKDCQGNAISTPSQNIVNQPITGNNIPANTIITAISGTTITMSANATGNATAELVTAGGQTFYQASVNNATAFVSNPSISIVGVTGSNGANPTISFVGTAPTAGNIIMPVNVQGTTQINGLFCVVGTVTGTTGSGATYTAGSFPCTNITWNGWGTYAPTRVQDVYPSWVLVCTSGTINNCVPSFAWPAQVISATQNSSLQNAQQVQVGYTRRVLAGGAAQLTFSGDTLTHEALVAAVGSTTLPQNYLTPSRGLHIHIEGVYTTTTGTNNLVVGALLGGQTLIGTTAGSIISAVPGTTAGVGCVVGDVLTLTSGGGTNGTVTVAAVTSGSPTSYTISAAGSGYAATTNATVSGGTCSVEPTVTIAIGGQTVTFAASKTNAHWFMDLHWKCKTVSTTCASTVNGTFSYSTGQNTAITEVALNNAGSSITTVVSAQNNTFSIPLTWVTGTGNTIKVNDSWMEEGP